MPASLRRRNPHPRQDPQHQLPGCRRQPSRLGRQPPRNHHRRHSDPQRRRVRASRTSRVTAVGVSRQHRRVRASRTSRVTAVGVSRQHRRVRASRTSRVMVVGASRTLPQAPVASRVSRAMVEGATPIPPTVPAQASGRGTLAEEIVALVRTIIRSYMLRLRGEIPSACPGMAARFDSVRMAG